uniref:OTU deubiquitinase with linear linkage specificity a n=1 Tax=Salarias fasciatus TaxID=181472 RepID=A0A672H1Z2_SALFA
MGNCCCRTESPCGSAEERSGLLKDDSKVTACAGEAVVAGTCGPEGDDDLRKSPDEQVKPVPAKPENGLTELSNTQENGPVQTESVQTAAPSPQQAAKLKENGTRAQDKDMKPEENATAEREVVASNAEVKEEDSSSAQGKIPDGASLTEDAARQEDPPQTETPTAEHTAASAPHDDGDQEEPRSALPAPDAAAESTEVLTESNEELVETPPAAASQPVHIPAASQKAQPLTFAETEDVDLGVSSAPPEDTESLHVCPSPPGSEPEGLGDTNQDSVQVPETDAPADASQSLNSDAAAESELHCATSLKETSEEEVMLEPQDKAEDVPKVKEDGEVKEQEDPESASTEAQTPEEAESPEPSGNGEQPAANGTADDTAAVVPAGQKEDSLGNSEEDLYRAAEDLSASQSHEAGHPPSSETPLLKVEDRCSLSPAVDTLLYSEREWKGNTAKSALIKKGYKEMSQRFGGVRRVRGDNYCALRATLFQVLSHSTHLPAWLQDHSFTSLPQQLAAQEGLISQWTFPGECLQGDGAGDATQQLGGYLELLQNKWRAAVDCASASERQQLCERVFRGGEEELGLLEALKLLMLSRAVELHGRMQAGDDVPLFCWLLFARDSSDCPHAFLANHLSHVGLSAGLEQVEMFLLGYALQCTIQVYRLYKAETEEFVTFYPDDHKDDWPSVCLVTEDDRHYNVPVADAAAPQEQPASS